jgi:hypothetical protein
LAHDFLSVEGSHPALDAILEAHVRAERMRSRRITSFHAIGLVGGLCWLSAAWGPFVPSAWRMIAAYGWPLCAGLFLWFLAQEWKWSSRIVRAVEAERSTDRRAGLADGRIQVQ